jgi:hypothetical protein
MSVWPVKNPCGAAAARSYFEANEISEVTEFISL